MKRAIIVALALICCATIHLAGQTEGDGWSAAVNGLQARLSFVRRGNGIKTYLELRRASGDHVGNVLEVPFRYGAIQFEVLNEQNKQMELSHYAIDEAFANIGILRLPLDSSLRLNITGHEPVPTAQTSLDLGPGLGWSYRLDDIHSYYLRGRFSVEKNDDPNRMRWSGTIEIPKVKIPNGRAR